MEDGLTLDECCPKVERGWMMRTGMCRSYEVGNRISVSKCACLHTVCHNIARPLVVSSRLAACSSRTGQRPSSLVQISAEGRQRLFNVNARFRHALPNTQLPSRVLD